MTEMAAALLQRCATTPETASTAVASPVPCALAGLPPTRDHALSVRLCAAAAASSMQIFAVQTNLAAAQCPRSVAWVLMASMDVILWARLLTDQHHPAMAAQRHLFPPMAAHQHLPPPMAVHQHLLPPTAVHQHLLPAVPAHKHLRPTVAAHRHHLTPLLVKGLMSLQWYLLWLYLEPCAIYFDQAQILI